MQARGLEDLGEAFRETNVLLQQSVHAALEQHLERQQSVLNQWKNAFGSDLSITAEEDLSPVPQERHAASIPHVSTWSGVRKAGEETNGEETNQELDLLPPELKGSLDLDAGGLGSYVCTTGSMAPMQGSLVLSEPGPIPLRKSRLSVSRSQSLKNFDYISKDGASKYAAKHTIQMEHASEWKKFLYRRGAKYLNYWYSLEEPPRTGLLARIVKSAQFNWLVISVIFVNCFYQWYQSNEEVKSAVKSDEIGTVEVCFWGFYTFEVFIKLIVHRAYFFCNDDLSWNLFDFFLVTVGAIDLLLRSALQGSNPSNSGSVKVIFLRVLRVLRLARILRGLKALRFFAELRLMLSCLSHSVQSLFWSIVMLVFIFYIFGLIFVQGIVSYIQDEKDVILDEDLHDILAMYGSVEQTMLTLYMASTGGNDWAIYYKALQPNFSKYVLLFFVSFIQIALLNILTGIFVENALKSAEPDLEEKAKEFRKKEIVDAEVLFRVCKDMGLGAEHSISRVEFAEAFCGNKLRAYMSVLGLRFDDPYALYELMIMTSEAEGEELKQEDFVTGCIRLKGNASNMDMYLLKNQVENVTRVQRDLVRQSENSANKVVAVAPSPRNSNSFQLPFQLRAPFECVVVGQDSWGMTLEVWSDYLEILEVKPQGRAFRYNSQQGQSSRRQIREGDLITQVGEAGKAEDMRQALQDQSLTEVNLCVHPAHRASIRIARSSRGETLEEDWGLVVTPTVNEKGLIVSGSPKIASPAHLYNQGRMSEDEKLQIGDVILSINGSEGQASQMLAALDIMAATSLELRILRPASSTSQQSGHCSTSI